jgi:hypothetical protein
MSGGSYDYLYLRIDELADKVRDRAARADYTHKTLRRAFAALLNRVAKAAYALEWADSGDTDFAEDALPVLRALVSRPEVLAQAVNDAKLAMAELSDAIALADKALS